MTGKISRVEQADLREQRRLIPVDVLVGELVALELRHDAERQPHVPARRSDARQQLIHRDVVREREDELVDHLLVADRPRDGRDLDVRGPLADEVPTVEATHFLETNPSGHHRHVVDIRVVGHRRHGGLEVQVNELRGDVLVEDPADVRLRRHSKRNLSRLACA